MVLRFDLNKPKNWTTALINEFKCTFWLQLKSSNSILARIQLISLTAHMAVYKIFLCIAANKSEGLTILRIKGTALMQIENGLMDFLSEYKKRLWGLNAGIKS